MFPIASRTTRLVASVSLNNLAIPVVLRLRPVMIIGVDTSG
jgi:hypothetical protein